MTATTSQRVARNTAALVAGRGFGAVSSLVLLRLSANYLGASEYGAVITALALVTLLGTLADWGMTVIASREMARDPSNASTLAGANLGLRTLIGVLLVPAAILVARLAYGDQHLVTEALPILVPLVVFQAASDALGSVFIARQRNDLAAVVDVVSRAVTLGLVAIVVAADLGYRAYLGSLTVAGLFSLVLTWVLSRRLARIRPRFDIGEWRSLLRVALPLGVVQVLNIVYFKIDSLLLAGFRTPAEVGHYGAAYKVIEFVMAIPSFFMLSLMPDLTVADEGRQHWLTQRAFDVLTTIALPIGLAGIAFAPAIVTLAAGAEFRSSATPLVILLVGATVSYASAVFGNTLVAVDRQRLLVRLTVVIVVLNVATNLALIPNFGMSGAAVATSISEVVAMVYVAFLFARATGFVLCFGHLRRTLAAAVPAALVVAAALATGLSSRNDTVTAVPVVIVAMLVYVGALRFLGGLEPFRGVLRAKVSGARG